MGYHAKRTQEIPYARCTVPEPGTPADGVEWTELEDADPSPASSGYR